MKALRFGRNLSLENSLEKLGVVEEILRDRQRFFREIRDGVEIPAKIRSMFFAAVTFFALYGAVLGSSSTLMQTVSSTLKLPILFLATLIICSPTLYFFNVLFGSNQSLSQNIALMLTALTVTSVILMSMAPITLFFLLTTDDTQYQFFKILNVGAFSIAGTVGLVYLGQGMRMVSGTGDQDEQRRRWLMRIWVIIYAFVGSQLAWTIRPFIGAPNMDFELFRQLGGNFYSDIFSSLGEILGFFIVQ